MSDEWVPVREAAKSLNLDTARTYYILKEFPEYSRKNPTCFRKDLLDALIKCRSTRRYEYTTAAKIMLERGEGWLSAPELSEKTKIDYSCIRRFYRKINESFVYIAHATSGKGKSVYFHPLVLKVLLEEKDKKIHNCLGRAKKRLQNASSNKELPSKPFQEDAPRANEWFSIQEAVKVLNTDKSAIYRMAYRFPQYINKKPFRVHKELVDALIKIRANGGNDSSKTIKLILNKKETWVSSSEISRRTRCASSQLGKMANRIDPSLVYILNEDSKSGRSVYFHPLVLKVILEEKSKGFYGCMPRAEKRLMNMKIIENHISNEDSTEGWLTVRELTDPIGMPYGSISHLTEQISKSLTKQISKKGIHGGVRNLYHPEVFRVLKEEREKRVQGAITRTVKKLNELYGKAESPEPTKKESEYFIPESNFTPKKEESPTEAASEGSPKVIIYKVPEVSGKTVSMSVQLGEKGEVNVQISSETMMKVFELIMEEVQ